MGRSGLDASLVREDDEAVIVTPLPWRGGVQPDLRNEGRALRVSAHPHHGLVSLSLWRDDACLATLQMSAADVSSLIAVLADTMGVLVGPEPYGEASAS
jgi:hypothetical protein